MGPSSKVASMTVGLLARRSSRRRCALAVVMQRPHEQLRCNEQGREAKIMAMDTGERDVLITLIGTVRTLAQQVVTLHLHLGALRAALVGGGVMTDAAFASAVGQLEALQAADEALRHDRPVLDQTFADLIARLERPPSS